MTSAAVDTASDRLIPPFATAAVLPLAAIVTILHCAASTLSRGYWFDEVYMLAIGRYHLDWGSADQPPVAPALAALMDAVAPGFRLALALPAALATGCAVLLAEQIAARTADVYRSLPQAQRDRTVVFGESYIIAAYLDGYSKRYRLPEAYSANRSYGYFPPPPADDDTVLYIGRDPAALRSRFADVRTLGDVGEDMHAYLLRGQRQSWARMWPQLRILTVT